MNPYIAILVLILGSLIGIPIAYLIFRKKIKLPQIKYNQQAQKLNDELQQKNWALSNQKIEITNKLIELDNLLLNKKQEIKEASFQLEETKAEASKIKDEFLKANLESAQSALDQQLEKAGKKYQEAVRDYQDEYLAAMADYVLEENKIIETKEQEYQAINEQIDSLTHQLIEIQQTISISVEALKRAEAEKSEKDFYRLILSDEDLAEIQTLRSVLPKIRDPLALNKAIWKVYYEKPYLALVGRVLGPARITGIYKITNLENGMTYVGQSTDIAERWKQHIKRGMGAEAPTRNKLYPAMQQEGVENFTFELLVECPKEKLNEEEDKYQEIFHCKDYGYSIK